MKRACVILTVGILLLSVFAYGQVPTRISFQGVLETTPGALVVDGSYDLRFALFDADGNQISYMGIGVTELHEGVSVERGTFQVILGLQLVGIIASWFDFDRPFYVEMTVVSGPDQPNIEYPHTFPDRYELTGSPYAFRVYSVDGAKGGDISGDLRLHGNLESGRITTQVLRINGGADLSEQFEIRGQWQADLSPAPGMVVCIDPEHPGELVVSSKGYDRTVAGVISGAGGVQPGMLMGQAGSVANGGYPVALTGRVYCWADASYAPIAPGDLLTTSNIPGHAMKVIDHAKAQGAIIGKAMTALTEGRGLVLVLVSLQ